MKACCKTKNENGGKVHRVPCGSVACSSSTARKPNLSKPVRGTHAPHTSAQAVHMLKTAEKSTALEDLWSINPSGALGNPACHVPSLQELSFQWLPQTGHRFSPCGDETFSTGHQGNLPRPHHRSNAEALGRPIESSFLPSLTIPLHKKGGPAPVFKAPELVHGGFQSNPV